MTANESDGVTKKALAPRIMFRSLNVKNKITFLNGVKKKTKKKKRFFTESSFEDIYRLTLKVLVQDKLTNYMVVSWVVCIFGLRHFAFKE